MFHLLQQEAVGEQALDGALRSAHTPPPQEARLEAIEQIERARRGEARDALGVVGATIRIQAVEAAQIEDQRRGRADGQADPAG